MKDVFTMAIAHPFRVAFLVGTVETAVSRIIAATKGSKVEPLVSIDYVGKKEPDKKD